ncbi:gamma-glutamyltransferase family protein [Candidatus Latescibacterota bacterium]
MKRSMSVVFVQFVIVSLIFSIPITTVIAAVGTRSAVRGQNGVVACGHQLAAEFGIHIMRQGGNAFDAGIAMVLTQSLLESRSFGFGGEMPTLIYSAKEKKVYEIDGNAAAPKAATIEKMKELGYKKIPDDGFSPAGVCAVPAAVITILDRFGTMSFEEVSEAVIRLAEKGYPMYEEQRARIVENEKRFKEEWPTSAALFIREGGRIPDLGEIQINTDFANTFKRLVQAERNALKASGGDRHAGLMAVKDYFYKGPIAEEIVKFQKENKFKDKEGLTNYGLLTVEDFAEYECRVGEPAMVNYRGYDVYKCGPWTQGPVFLQQLNILEGYDLKAMGHNSLEYIHTWIESAKLAHADKNKYYGDPNYVYVPMDGLLSKKYAAERRKLIDPNKASLELRPGDPYPYDSHPERRPKDLDLGSLEGIIPDHGTTGTRAIDAEGNMFSSTPSGGWIFGSPVIPGLGFCLGTRIQMFYLEEGLAKSLAPGKRPSTSLTPTLVMKDGEPVMVFGMPGGDLQDQGTLSCFLNIIDFEMEIQDALDAPKFWTSHFPSLFYPLEGRPGRMSIERRVEDLDKKLEQLRAMGHLVGRGGNWSGDNTMICRIDREHHTLEAASNPRFLRGFALAW